MRWKLLATVVPMGLAAAGLVAQTVLFAKGATTPLAAVLVMCIFVGSWRWLTQVRVSVGKLAQAKSGH